MRRLLGIGKNVRGNAVYNADKITEGGNIMNPALYAVKTTERTKNMKPFSSFISHFSSMQFKQRFTRSELLVNTAKPNRHVA